MKSPYLWLGCLLLVGCGHSAAQEPPSTERTAAGKQAAADAKPGQLPPDIATRKQGVDWPQFLGPTGDSKSSETGLITPWPKAGPRLVWQTPVGLGYAQASVSRGRLYLFDSMQSRARLRCLNSETGEELWKFEYPSEYEDYFGYDNGPRCAPTVDGERVYTIGPEGLLHCLSATTGEVVWKLDTVERFGVVQNFFGVGSTPVVEDDLLILHVGGSPPGSKNLDFAKLQGNGTGVVAVDKLTGEVKYKFSSELAGYASPVLTTIGDRRWGFVFARGGLIGFDPATGKQDFHYPWRAPILESVNASNPVVVDDLVLISECYGVGSSVLRVKPGGYEKVWTDEDKGRNKSLMNHWNTPIHHDGYVYGSSGRHTNGAELRCVELATGKVMWSEPGMSRASLLSIDGHFICLGEYGDLWLLKINPQKYDEVSHIVLRRPGGTNVPGFGPAGLLAYPAWAAPIVSHGLMYVRGRGTFACVEVIPNKAAKPQ